MNFKNDRNTLCLPRNKHSFWLMFTITLFILIGVRDMALACVDYTPPTPPTLIIERHSPTSVWITICGYTSFGADSAHFCACALNLAGPILSVNSVKITDTLGVPLPGFDFQPNANTGNSVSNIQPGNWSGFLADVDNIIPPGIPVKIMIECTVDNNLSTGDIASSIATNFPLIATDEANATGTITQGHLVINPTGKIRVVEEPVIHSVSPLNVAAGDIITIQGENFGNKADNLCVIVMDGNRSIPLQALTANDTSITAEVGFIAPDANPGPVAVGLGVGSRGIFDPAFPNNIIVEDSVWVWDRTGGMAVGQDTVECDPGASQDSCRWLFSEEPVDGKLCLIIPPDCVWPDSAKIRISARAHDHQTGIGRDLAAFCIRIIGAQSNFECAQYICDVIRCAFLQQAGIDVLCDVVQLSNGAVKITLQLPNGFINWGNLDVCILEPDPPTAIEDIFTTTPDRFVLAQNYPNPFNPTTSITYYLEKNMPVSLRIYNVAGQLVRTLVNKAQAAGRHEVQWNAQSDLGAPVASGIYIYKLEAGSFVQTRKMILLR